MNPDQNEICQYLKTCPGQFISSREISRRAGGKWRYREDPNWAAPILRGMLETRLVEADSTGHFRLTQEPSPEQKQQPQRWMSPAIRAILLRSRKDFGVIDLDKELDAAEIEAGLGSILEPTR